MKSCSLDLALLGVVTVVVTDSSVAFAVAIVGVNVAIVGVNVDANDGVVGMVTPKVVVFRFVQFFSLLLLGGAWIAFMMGW